MSSDETGIWVPARSNAYSLVSGAPVAAVRRRLKAASITFDRVLLDQAQLHIQAGPGGSIALPIPDETGDAFQTARQRRASKRFYLGVAKELDANGAPIGTQAVIDSETQINWVATLQPFRQELSARCDWIAYGTWPDYPPAKVTAQRWGFEDQRNAALQAAIPHGFVRRTVIGNANQDLAVSAHAGVAVLQDSLHRKVWGSRFADQSMRPAGFAIPVLLPAVGEMAWDDIATIRNHKSMRDFRRIMREVELQALETARSGDLEAAAQRAFAQYLAKAAGKVEGLISVAKAAIYELSFGTLVGGGVGLVAAGWGGPGALLAGGAVGGGRAAIEQGVSVVRARKARGWISVYQQLSSP